MSKDRILSFDTLKNRENRMNLEANLVHEDGYVLIEFSGEYNRQEMEKLILGLYSRVKQTKCDNVLVDVSMLPGSIPNVDRFYLGTYYAREIGLNLKTAIVNRKDEITGLFEDTVVNRSGNVCVFAGKSEALAWLGIDS